MGLMQGSYSVYAGSMFRLGTAATQQQLGNNENSVIHSPKP